MKELIVPIKKFDFKRFTEASIKFAEKVLSPGYAVFWVEVEGVPPEEVNNYKEMAALSDLLKEGAKGISRGTIIRICNAQM